VVTKLAVVTATAKSFTVVKQKECRKSLLSSNQKVAIATTIRMATKVVSIVFIRLRIN